MGLENGREILSRNADKFNTRRKIRFAELKFTRAANLKFRRKFKIYSAQNLTASRFLKFYAARYARV